MTQSIKKRIHALRQQPEHVRIQAATKFTIIGGIVCAIIWLVIFLPLQLRLRQGAVTPDEQPQQKVTASPSPISSSTLAPDEARILYTGSPTPVPSRSPEVQGLQFLPSSEDKVTPTP